MRDNRARNNTAATGVSTSMCMPTTCQSCRKTTWMGCGEHIDEVFAGVPEDQRCTCE
jgi:hypothetical protein